MTADRLTTSDHNQPCLGSLSICSALASCRFLPDRASSTIMLKNPSRGVACGQLKKRRPGQKGLTASMQHEQSSHSMHAMLQAVSTLHLSDELAMIVICF